MKVSLSLLCAAAFLWDGTALAKTDVIPGQILWGQIKTGMTKAEFKALYPTGRIELSSGCIAEIHPSYEDRGVSSIELAHGAKSTSKSCGTTMRASLLTKYGKPRSDQQRTEFFDRSCSGKLMCAARDAIVAMGMDRDTHWRETSWFTGDTYITLTHNLDTEEWKITYFQAHLAQPEAARNL